MPARPASPTVMNAQPCRTYLPPEWAPQSGVMLTWPHSHSDWEPVLEQVEPVFLEIAQQVARFEKVLIVCHDESHRAELRTRVIAAGIVPDRLVLAVAPSNDTWARDHGPITIRCGNELRLLDFRFNGWGGKYAHDLDDAIPRRLSGTGAFGELPLQRVDLVLEGGGIEVDGSGTLLATERCLLAPTRNPGIVRAAIERELGELFGLKRVLWLRHGALAGDDTDSHIDTLARFCSARTIAYVACDDPADEHYRELQDMETELRAMRAADGRPYDLQPLPWPRAKLDPEGKRMPATYANFLIINGAVLVPTYRDPADVRAIECLRSCFPDREVIGIDCLPLIQQHGSLHCVTMQLPAGVI